MLDASPDGVVIMELDGTITFVSRKALKLWGYENESEVLGRNVREFFAPEHHEDAFYKIHRILNGAEPFSTIYKMIQKDGSVFYGESNSAAIHHSDGMPAQFLIIQRDVTKKVILEEQLKQQNEELNELNATKNKFFSIIAHDLKNCFHGVMGLSETLLYYHKEFKEDELEQYLSTIHQSTNNSYRLLVNLLKWAMAQTGSLKIQPEKIFVSSLVRVVFHFLQKQLDAKDLKLIYSVPENLVVTTDYNILSTVFRNLISNAIKYSYFSSEIKITFDLNGEFTIFSVIDKGMGMGLKTKEGLFKLCSTKSRTGTNGETGTGLGLMVCKEFVEKLGGSIWVESEKDKGSSFHFSIKTNL